MEANKGIEIEKKITLDDLIKYTIYLDTFYQKKEQILYLQLETLRNLTEHIVYGNKQKGIYYTYIAKDDGTWYGRFEISLQINGFDLYIKLLESEK